MELVALQKVLPEITALGSYVNAQVAPSLGRNLTGATSVNVALLPPMTTYGERLNQIDFRFAKKFTIDQGTQLSVRLVDPIDSEKNQSGDTIHATLSTPLTSDGEEAVPAGVEVVGHLVEVKSAGKFAGPHLDIDAPDRLDFTALRDVGLRQIST